MATITSTQRDQREINELVIRARGGDREAFGELFERFERHVFAIALRKLGDYAEAQELCQDVFVQALQKIDQLRQPECFGGWLRSITHRMAINRFTRRDAATATEPMMLEAACVDAQTPLASAIAGERSRCLRAGMARLRKLDRETLEAFYVNGQSLAEMSVRFEAPLGTIKRRLHVARKRLAKQVEQLVAV